MTDRTEGVSDDTHRKVIAEIDRSRRLHKLYRAAWAIMVGMLIVGTIILVGGLIRLSM